MRVFVATSKTQGDRPGDYSFTVDGELVRFAFDICSCPGCGCDRGIAGLSSSKASTTFTVEDIPDLTIESYTETLRDSLVREGWVQKGDDPPWVEELAQM